MDWQRRKICLNYNLPLALRFSSPMLTYDLNTLKDKIEAAKLAGFIYQHQQHILVLQEPLTDNLETLSFFAQHETTSDQIGLQFAIKLIDNQLKFLIGATHSNQDRGYEIGVGNLKGEQKAFNLLYAFYNYPKAFYLVELPLFSTSAQLEQALNEQLLNRPELNFIQTATKTNPRGQQVQWIKDYIVQQSLDMKVRIQTALL